MLKKACKNCGEEFDTEFDFKVHCSKDCRLAWKYKNTKAKRDKKKSDKPCANPRCKKMMINANVGRKYCSDKCRETIGLTGEPTGRKPTYKPEYCDMVINHMKGGKSLASFAASIGTFRQVLWSWRQKYRDFDDACNIAIELALDWWENFAALSATGRIFDPQHEGKYNKHNPGMIQFIMRQRFYRDYNRQAVQEIDVNVKPKITYKTSMSKDGRMIQDVIDDVLKEEGFKE